MGLSTVSPQKIVIVTFTRKREVRAVKEPSLSGRTVQLTTEIIYLGLILNLGLKRNAQLKNVMNKAYRTFWTCKGIFCKMWGLKPRVVHLIYTMVIIFMLTCSSKVWWLRVRYIARMTELSKL
jgi:hypothetical protein